MVKTNIFLSTFIVITSLSSIFSTKIVLVKSKPNDYLIKHQRNKQRALLPNAFNDNVDNDSERICKSIQGTFNVLGKDSMKSYEQCQGKYELLGLSDDTMKLDSPSCYTSLSTLFCNEYITASPNSLYDINLIKFILSLINQCIHYESTGLLKSQYICPTLNEENYIIEDPDQFCLKAEKKVIFIDSETKETYEYLRVKESKQRHCLNVVEAYNFCINSENVLYPSKNYTQCFRSTHSLYLGNTIEKYNKKERDFCQKYILPSFASMNLHSTIGINNEDICDKFDQKIIKQHDTYSNGVEKRIEDMMNSIKQKEEMITFIKAMIKSSQELLDTISNIISAWKDVKEYINKRMNKVYNKELKALDVFNENLDLLFESSVSVKKILEQKSISNDELTKVLPYYQSILDNCRILFSKSNNQLSELVTLFKTEPNNSNSQEIKENLNVDASVKQMDTKLMEIITNEKAYMKYLREQLVNHLHHHEEELQNIQSEKENKIIYKEKIINQKNSYQSSL